MQDRSLSEEANVQPRGCDLSRTATGGNSFVRTITPRSQSLAPVVLPRIRRLGVRISGASWSAPAQRLIGTGLLAVAPTVWTGWAEWCQIGPRDKRVGLVHAVTNGVAISVYAASWVARRQGRHGTGARLALAGAAVSGVGAYLGGHLAEARKVSSHHPAFNDTLQEA